MENPNLNQEVIPVSAFSGIQFKAVGKILLSQGATESLTIEADPETRSHIHTEVKDGLLRITQDTDWRDWTGFRLIDRGLTTFHLVMKDIKTLAISGVGAAAKWSRLMPLGMTTMCSAGTPAAITWPARTRVTGKT